MNNWLLIVGKHVQVWRKTECATLNPVGMKNLEIKINLNNFNLKRFLKLKKILRRILITLLPVAGHKAAKWRP